jgi:hypothetical protein
MTCQAIGDAAMYALLLIGIAFGVRYILNSAPHQNDEHEDI